MADILSILLKAEIDIQNSLSGINTQLGQLQKKINTIKVKIDSKQFDDLNNQIDKVTKKMSSNSKNSLDKDFIKLYQAEMSMLDKVEDKRVKTVENRRNLEKKAEEAQAKAINKNFEDEQKSQQKKAQAIEKQKQMYTQMFDTIRQKEDKTDQKKVESINKQKQMYTQMFDKIAADEQKAETREQNRIAKFNEKVQDVSSLDWGNTNSLKDFTKTLETQDTKVESFTKTLDSAGNEIVKFKLVTRDGSDMTKEQTMVLDKNTQSLYRQSEAMRPNINRMLGFVNQLKIAIERSVTWGLAMGALYGSIRKVREGIEFISDLDKDLTQIRVITGMTDEQTRNLAESYAELGFQVGKTVKEISGVSVELYRQGLALEEVDKRMRVITQMSAVGNIDIDQTLKVITSSVNALGEESEKTADILLKAGAISASSAEEIGEALTKTASSAKSTGLSIEQTTAYLSSLIEITQESPESLGNSLKTLLARFTKINEETGEVNENLNEVQRAFESVNIDFTDAEGQIRPFGDLLGELSTKWDGLNKNTQFYLATQAAGKFVPENTVMYLENSAISEELLPFMLVA